MGELCTTSSSLTIYDSSYVEKLKEENEEQKLKIIRLHSKIEEMEKKQVELPERYIINENATILFWKNGEKTVVRRCTDDEFNPRLAFLTAFFQHYVDMSKNKANKYLANLQVEVEKEEPNFNIGDIVEVIKNDEYSKKGWKGEIIRIDENDVKVDYTNGQCWWVLKDNIKLIKEGK